MAVTVSIGESPAGNLLVSVSNTGPYIIVIERIILKRQRPGHTFISWHREDDFVYGQKNLEENIAALFLSRPPGMSKPFTATARVNYFQVNRAATATRAF